MDNVKMKLGLGTVQFGLAYGINNSSGKPTGDEIDMILDIAIKSGVHCIDTATAYGDSEDRVGEYLKHTSNKEEILISTKINSPPLDYADIYQSMKAGCLKSLARLKTSKIEYLLFHDVGFIKGNKIAYSRAIQRLKESGMISKWGVSLYSVDELENCLQFVKPDVIQIPFNILDRRFLKNDVLKNVKKSGIEVHARSIFLQGLLLMGTAPDFISRVQPLLDKLSALAVESSLTIKEIALLYVRDHPYIDRFFIGCEKVPQIEEIIAINNYDELTQHISLDIRREFDDVDEEIINPTKKILFTGAGSYLGASMSEALARYGASIALTSRYKVRATEIASQYQNQFSGKFVGIGLDISSEDSVCRAIDVALQTMGHIDILINNAVVTVGGLLDDIDLQAWEKGVGGSVHSVFQMVRAVLPSMIAKGKGNIINIASMYGVVPPDYQVYEETGVPCNPPSYGVGKAGVIQLTRYISAYYGKDCIRSNSISPGPFPNAEMQKNSKFINNLSRKTHLGRIGFPEDMNGIIVLLASDASAYISGQNISVDGGWTSW